MGLLDASSKTSTSDTRQTAGDSSQLAQRNAKIIQGGTDLSNSKINTGVQASGKSKITGTDLSKTNFGNGATVTIGAPASDLTALAQSAIDALGHATTAFPIPVPTPPGATPTPASGASGSGLDALISGVLGSIGQSQTPAPSATSGDDKTSGQATGLSAWWNGLSSTVKIGIGVAAVLLIGALIFFGKKA